MQEDGESQDQQEDRVVHKDIKQLDAEPNGWTKSACWVKKEEEWDTGKEKISCSLEIELCLHTNGVFSSLSVLTAQLLFLQVCALIMRS